MLFSYDARWGRLVNLHVQSDSAFQPHGPAAARVFSVHEDNGLDLNGDGDTFDSVYRVVRFGDRFR